MINAVNPSSSLSPRTAILNSTTKRIYRIRHFCSNIDDCPRKPTDRETHIVENEPYQNYLNYYCFLIWLRIDNEPHLYDRATQLARKLNEGQFNRNLLGEPDAEARQAIQQLFETAIDELRHLGAHTKMQPAWMNWLVSTFINEHTTEHTPPYSLQAA